MAQGNIPQQDWRPIPDPTVLTDAAIVRATDQFHREMDALREFLIERISVNVLARDAALSAIKATIDARLDGMDIAATARIRLFELVPEQIRNEVDHLRQLHEIKFDSI